MKYDDETYETAELRKHIEIYKNTPEELRSNTKSVK